MPVKRYTTKANIFISLSGRMFMKCTRSQAVITLLKEGVSLPPPDKFLKQKDLPEELNLSERFEKDPEAFVLKGGSCIIGPDGKYIVEPVFNQEKIIIADIDTERVYEERMTLDVSGHYQRNDVFSFQFKQKRKK